MMILHGQQVLLSMATLEYTYNTPLRHWSAQELKAIVVEIQYDILTLRDGGHSMETIEARLLEKDHVREFASDHSHARTFRVLLDNPTGAALILSMIDLREEVAAGKLHELEARKKFREQEISMQRTQEAEEKGQ